MRLNLNRMKEKCINGYEGLYWIYPDGRILTRNWKNTGREAILRPATDKKGYKRVALMKDGKLSTHKVHRLVAINFIPNPSSKPQVNHKDGDKSNNHVDNLEWATNAENVIHAIRNGAIKIFNSDIKITSDEDVVKIRNMFNAGFNKKEISVKLNITKERVNSIIRKRSFKHL